MCVQSLRSLRLHVGFQILIVTPDLTQLVGNHLSVSICIILWVRKTSGEVTCFRPHIVEGVLSFSIMIIIFQLTLIVVLG